MYLAEGLEQRKRLMKEFRRFTNAAPEAVHEGTLPKRVTVDGQSIPIGQFIARAEELFKKSLLKVIESGRLPDWDSIELGAGTQ